MRDILKILGLLFIASVIFALGNSTEQQDLSLPIVEQIESEICQSNSSSPLNIISSRQSSTTPTARRLYSSQRLYKAHCTATTSTSSTTQLESNFINKPTSQPSLSLVFRLHNIRV